MNFLIVAGKSCNILRIREKWSTDDVIVVSYQEISETTYTKHFEKL